MLVLASDMSLQEPLESRFRIAQIGIGYDADRDMVILVMQGIEVLNVNGTTLTPNAGQPGGPGLVYLVAVTPAQAEHLVYLTTFEQLYFSLLPKAGAPNAYGAYNLVITTRIEDRTSLGLNDNVLGKPAVPATAPTPRPAMVETFGPPSTTTTTRYRRSSPTSTRHRTSAAWPCVASITGRSVAGRSSRGAGGTGPSRR